MPNLFTSIKYGWKMAVQAFKEDSLISSLATQEGFGDFETRKSRYAIYWAMFENSAYSDVHGWAKAFRSNFGLYRHIRSIYNPAAELVDFWSDALMGGILDREAGDGVLEESALPLLFPHGNDRPEIREAVANIWKTSNWQVNKDIYTAFGAAMGDVFLKPVVRPDKGFAYMKVIHPAYVKELEKNDLGEVEYYMIEMPVAAPGDRNRIVRYTEVVEQKGDKVTYTTYQNGQEFAWDGVHSTWNYEYGFVPLIHTMHNDVGADWGWAELHRHRQKFLEVDDMASVLHDQIRKLVTPIWMFKGMTAPKSGKLTTSHSDPSLNDPQKDREEMPAIFAGEKADAQALTTSVNLPAVSAEIQNVLLALEKAYPELRQEIPGGGEASAKSIREMRRLAESKVIKRRIGYDAGLALAHKQTMALAGFHEVAGFSEFRLEDYHNNDLEHYIGDRVVYDADPMDEAELSRVFWQGANEAERAGVGLDVYLAQQGWSEANIRRVQETEAYKSKESSYKALQALNEEAIRNPLGNPSAVSQNGPVGGLNKNQMKTKEQSQTEKVATPGADKKDEDGTKKKTEAKRQSVTND